MPEWTEQQKQAIYSKEPGIIVSAAAGSGKTAVLAERISNLAFEKGIESIVAVTFTRLAAAEIKDRVKTVLRKKYEQTHSPVIFENLTKLPSASICTIDSFITNLVRRNFASL